MKVRNKQNWLRVIAFFILPLTFLSTVVFAHDAAKQNTAQYDSVEIGALDADAWNGIVFIPNAFKQQAPFAIRFGSQLGGNFTDGRVIFHKVREVGPSAPDGSYSRMAWTHSGQNSLITLEWSRVDQTTVVGRITTPPKFRLVVESYFPTYFDLHGGTASWDIDHYAQGFYSIDDSHQAILGERYFDGVFDRTSRFLVTVDRPTMGSGTYRDRPNCTAIWIAPERLSPQMPLPLT